MVGYDPIIHTPEEGRNFAEENPEVFPERFAQEYLTISDLDPKSPEIEKPHQHQTHRTRNIGKDLEGRDVEGKTELCACGARRDVNLTKSSPWVGGNIPLTNWEKARLEAVRRAVENTPDLLDLQPNAVQDINQGPPRGHAHPGPEGPRPHLRHRPGSRPPAHRLPPEQQPGPGMRGHGRDEGGSHPAGAQEPRSSSSGEFPDRMAPGN